MLGSLGIKPNDIKIILLTQKDISKASQDVLNEIISKMTKSVPQSFALHYAMYLNAQKSTEAFESLKKANSLQPDSEELLV